MNALTKFQNGLVLSARTKSMLSWFLLIFFVFLLLPDTFCTPLRRGLDEAWVIALQLAWKNHLTFGKDIVFTYGPLGALQSRRPAGIGKLTFLLADAWFVLVVFSGLRTFIRMNFRLGPLLFIFLCIIISLGMEWDQWFYFFFLFFLFSYLREPARIIYLAQAALLSLFCFFFKANSGMVVIIILMVILHYALARKKVTPRLYIIFILSYAAALYICARLLHTDLVGYVKGSLQFIKDYGDAMSLPLTGYVGAIAAWGAILIWSVLLTGFLLFAIRLLRIRSMLALPDTVLIYGIVGFSTYMWFKSGFTRADSFYHLYHFFQMIGPLTLLLYLYTPAGLGKRTMAVCCWTILGATWVVMSLFPDDRQPNGPIAKALVITRKIDDIKKYIAEYQTYDQAVATADSLTALPNRFKEMIGRHSVDAMPFDIYQVYFNGLHYTPRPTLQSYAAYDDYLDNLDREKYSSATAPDYILFENQTIDGRYAFADETRTKLAMIDLYSAVGRMDGQLILKKRDIPRQWIKSGEESLQVKLGQDIPVKRRPGFQFSQFFIDDNLAGHIHSFFYQPPGLSMTFTLENGDVITYRAIKPILADGMILNKYIDDTREFQLMMLSDGEMNANVRSVRIESEDHNSGFEPAIRMVNTYYTMDKKTESDWLADSISIRKLASGYGQPAALLHMPSDSDQADFHLQIENFHDQGNFVRISGWAFRVKDSNDNNSIAIVARSEDDNKLYELPAQSSTRQDLNNIYKRQDLVNAGFSAAFFESQLPPGNYQIGIGLIDKINGKIWVKYTDRYVGGFHLEKTAPVANPSVDMDKVEYGIDMIDENEDNFMVRGWAGLAMADSNTATNLILQNDTAAFRINTELKDRLDIAGKYKKPSSERSGFFVLIPKAGLPKGSYMIGIERIAPGGKKRSLIWTGRKIKMGVSDRVLPIRIGSLPAAKDFYSNFDVVQDDPEIITVAGWALADTLDATGNTIQVVLKGDSSLFASATEQSSRPDIAGRFNNFRLENCGFSTKIAKSPLPKGRYQLGILIYNKDKFETVRLLDQFIEKR